MSFEIKKYTLEELAQEENKFQLLSETEREDLFASLHEQLVEYTPEQDYEGRYSYFRWFTDLVWSDILALDKEYFITIAIKRQLFEAIQMGIPVWDKIVFYFYNKCFTSDDYRVLFIQMRDTILYSGEILGVWNGKNYTIQDAVQEKKLIASKRNNSIEMAEFLTKLKKIISLDNNQFAEKFFLSSTDEAIRQLIECLDTIIDTQPDDMEVAVDMLINPESYGFERNFTGGEAPVVSGGNIPRKGAISAPVEPVKSAAVLPVKPNAGPAVVEPLKPKIADKVTRPLQALPPKAPVKTEPQPSVKSATPAIPVKPSYAEIRNKIEAVFPKNAQGEYANLDGILAALQSASVKYNDPKIAELMYFDEADNTFKWSI